MRYGAGTAGGKLCGLHFVCTHSGIGGRRKGLTPAPVYEWVLPSTLLGGLGVGAEWPPGILHHRDPRKSCGRRGACDRGMRPAEVSRGWQSTHGAGSG